MSLCIAITHCAKRHQHSRFVMFVSLAPSLPLSLSSPLSLSPLSSFSGLMLIYHLKLKSAVLGNGCSDHKNNDIFNPKGLKESCIGQPYNLLSLASSLPLSPLIPLPSLPLSLPPSRPTNADWETGLISRYPSPTFTLP